MTAFSTLHERNAAAAMSVARGLTRSTADAEDLVAEGFTKVMEAVRRGNGPEDAFRPYLLTVIRRLAYDTTARRQREEVSATAGEEASIDPDDPAIVGLERELVRDAFATLPERWQTVLWQTEVEERSPQDIAPDLGLTANAAAALTYRAREGLRQAYLAAHRRQDTDPGCGRVLDRLPAYVRGSLASRGERAVATHLDTCDRCLAAYLELIEINSDLRAAFVGFGALAVTAAAAVSQVAGHLGWGPRAGGLVRRTVGQARVHGVQIAAATAVGVAAVAVAVGLASSPGPSTPQALTPTTAAPGRPSVRTNHSTKPEPPPTGTSVPVEGPAAPDRSGPTTTRPVGRAAPASPAPKFAGPTTSLPSIVAPRNPPMSVPPVVPGPVRVQAASVGSLAPSRSGVVALTVRDLPGGFDAGSVAVSATGGTVSPQPGSTTCLQSGPSVVCSLVAPTAPGLVSRFVRVRPASGAAVVDLALHLDGRAVLTSARDVAIPVPVGSAAFRSQFADEGHLGLASTGGTVVSCPTAADGCTDARQFLGDRPQNNDWDLAYVDTDTDAGTFDSSSAPLSIPAGATVRFAGLTFGGSLEAGEGGHAAPDAAAASRAVLVGPGGRRAVVTAAAEDVDRLVSGASDDQYQAFVDVTDLVRSGGTFTVGNVQVATGRSAFGGWSLTVVYEDAALPVRVASVLTGLVDAPGVGGAATFGLGGLGVGGGSAADVSITSWEGDAGLGPESARLWGVTLANADNPADDFANSSNAGLPGTNMFGVDIDRLTVAPAESAGAAWLEVDGGDDVWSIGTIASVVPRSSAS